MGRLRTLLLERFTIAIACAILATALFVVIAAQVAERGTRQIDGEIAAYWAARQTPLLHTAMQGVSLLASGGAQTLIGLGCVWAIWRRPPARADALGMLAAIIGGELLVDSLKALFHRPRPSPAFAHLGYSFPSGHSFFAVTLYGMAAYWLTRPRGEGGPRRRHGVWPLAVALILLIGLSRVILGVHYASDVLAGFAAGVPWLWACLALPRAFRLAQKEGAA